MQIGLYIIFLRAESNDLSGVRREVGPNGLPLTFLKFPYYPYNRREYKYCYFSGLLLATSLQISFIQDTLHPLHPFCHPVISI